MKFYFRIGECVGELEDLKGQRAAGFPTEYTSFGDNITYKPGYHCTIAASPASGKSFFVLGTVVKLAERFGQRTLIFSPEMGSKAEITALLVEIKSGKTIYDIEGKEKISEEELELCLRWLNNHFLIIDSELSLTIENIYEQFEKCQDEYKIKVHNIVVDNLNDLKEPSYTQRQDLNVERMYTFIRMMNKKHNCYTFLVTHSSSQGSPIVQGDIRYYPPITPREIRSGEAIYRKAYLLLTLWRPPYGLKDENEIPYEKNETHVIVLKAKPANTATKGFVGKLYFNWSSGKFTDHPPVYRAYG